MSVMAEHVYSEPQFLSVDTDRLGLGLTDRAVLSGPIQIRARQQYCHRMAARGTSQMGV